MMVKWGFLFSALIMLGPTVWFLYHDNILFAAIGLLSIFAIVVRSHRAEPELNQADREHFSMHMRLLPVFIIFAVAIFFLKDIDSYDQIITWVLLPGMIILAVWATWIWPFIVHYRAAKRIRERKQREAA